MIRVTVVALGIRKIIRDMYFNYMNYDVKNGRYVIVPDIKYARSGPLKAKRVYALKRSKEYPTFILMRDGRLVFVLNSRYVERIKRQLAVKGIIIDDDLVAKMLKAEEYRREVVNPAPGMRVTRISLLVHKVPKEVEDEVNKSRSVKMI